MPGSTTTTSAIGRIQATPPNPNRSLPLPVEHFKTASGSWTYGPVYTKPAQYTGSA